MLIEILSQNNQKYSIKMLEPHVKMLEKRNYPLNNADVQS